MSLSPRLIAPDKRGEDADMSLRPQTLDEFVGQAAVRANLKVFIEAAKGRGEALDHVLFVGPPGLGKTTLAQIMARELGVNFRSTSGPVIAKAGDLAALLTNLEDRDVLFIDEVHRLNPAVEEILYPAMEDFQLDLIIGEGPAARSVKIDLARFTLVAATTRLGLLTNPLRDRFGIPVRLNFYSVEELEMIVRRGARILSMPLGDDGALEIARRARGTPRIAGRLLRRVRDFASVAGAEHVSRAVADAALSQAGGRRARPRPARPPLSHHDRSQFRRRAGRHRDDRGRAVGTARRHRGHHRALSHPARLHPAHAARPRADGQCLEASRPRRAKGPGAAADQPVPGRVRSCRASLLRKISSSGRLPAHLRFASEALRLGADRDTRRGFLRLSAARCSPPCRSRLCGRHRADAADACEALRADAAGLAGWVEAAGLSRLPTSMPAGHG